MIVILIIIITGVAYFIARLIGRQDYRRSLFERQFLEAVWTVLPALILIIVAVPSLSILYRLDNSDKSQITLKVLGHQWY